MTQQDNDQAWDNTPANPDTEGLVTPPEQQEVLSEDNDIPATPAEENQTPVAPDYPAMDGNLDEHEAYDAGETTASGVNAQDETDEDKNEAITPSQQ